MTNNIPGIFKVHDTHGYPLSEIVKDLKERGYNVCWKSWIKDSLKAGWEYDKAKLMALDSLKGLNPRKDFRVLFLKTYLMVLNKKQKKEIK